MARLRRCAGCDKLGTMTDDLCTIEASYQKHNGTLRASTTHLWFDRFNITRGGKWERPIALELAIVRTIDIREIRAEETRRRLGLIGIWAKKTTPARTGILVTTTDGTRHLFETNGTPVEVEATIGRLLDQIDTRQP